MKCFFRYYTNRWTVALVCAVFISVLVAIPVSLHAATMGFSPSTVSRTVGSTFSVSAYVSSSDKAANAASGVVSFPSDKLEVIGVSKAGSIINLWVQEPSFSNAQGTVNFEGIALNPGYTGGKGTILTVTFRTKSAGQADIRIINGSVLANDGVGTNILTGAGTTAVSIQAVPVLEKIKPETVPTYPPSTKKPTKVVPAGTAGPVSASVMEIPIIADYQEEVESGDLIKIHGIASPGSDVEIRLSRSGESVQIKSVRSTASGNFTMTLDAPSQPGAYVFVARAIDEAGNESKETSPFTIVVTSKWIDRLVSSLLSYLSVTMLIALVMTGVIVSFALLWSRSLRIIRRIRKKDLEEDKILEKSFRAMRKDIDVHIIRLKAASEARMLTAEEVLFLEEFERNITEAEDILTKKMKEDTEEK